VVSTTPSHGGEQKKGDIYDIKLDPEDRMSYFYVMLCFIEAVIAPDKDDSSTFKR
jgi:hypothetical protein